MTGKLIIISSPSGGGKGTLIKELRETVPDLAYSVSWTTRAARYGEIDGVHYHFVSEKEFEDQIKSDGFLEYAEVHGHKYGTLRQSVEAFLAEGKDVILEIDVQGADKVMNLVPDAISIFILPPSFETLRARLIARATESSGDLEVRLSNSRLEVLAFERFKYVVINDELTNAARNLASIVIAERQRPDRQISAIRSILDSFEKSKTQISNF
ncbi:MAG TPA: guanylate kinase [Pyrinomonadaceae bacterium]|nr:guanylate kinase [Pyrinomonadaceae bacterium]